MVPCVCIVTFDKTVVSHSLFVCLSKSKFTFMKKVAIAQELGRSRIYNIAIEYG